MLNTTNHRRRLGAAILAGAIALGGLAACSGGESADSPPDVRATPIGAWAIEATSAITGDEASDDADAFAAMWATAHGPDAWLDILTGSELAEKAAIRHLGDADTLAEAVEELRESAPQR